MLYLRTPSLCKFASVRATYAAIAINDCCPYKECCSFSCHYFYVEGNIIVIDSNYQQQYSWEPVGQLIHRKKENQLSDEMKVDAGVGRMKSNYYKKERKGKCK